MRFDQLAALSGRAEADGRRNSALRIAGFFAFAVFTTAAFAAPTRLNFEDEPPFTIINGQYTAKGVRFQGAFIATDLGARSGTRALRSIPPTSEVFEAVPFVITFTRPQARVALFANSPGTVRNGTLQAFDSRGELIVEDGPKPVAADAFTTKFEVTAPRPLIKRAVLRLENAAHYAIDDLEFDRERTVRPLVEVIETRQPETMADPAVDGVFPGTFVVPPPREAATDQRRGEDGERDEAEERFDMKFAPSIERELAPGDSVELKAAVAAKTGLAGSVRWSGTPAPLAVTLSINGTEVTRGRSYAIGQNRGGANLGGVAQSGGEAKLSVTNTSAVTVRVLLSLGMVPRPGG